MRGTITNKIQARDIATAVLVFLNVVLIYTMRQGTSSSYLFTISSSEAQNKEGVAPVAQQRKKTALCAIVKNEEFYLDEWVDYHQGLGFEKIYIYDNSDGNEMKQWGKLKGDHVEVVHLLGPQMQLMSYLNCHARVQRAGIFEWIAFFDLDEYLVLRKHDHVSDMLQQHCSVGKLGVNWLWFDYNNWMIGAPEPITRRFLYRKKETNQHIKTIARVEDIDKINIHSDPHNFVDLRRKPRDSTLMHDTNNKRFKGPFNKRGPTDVVALHHYHSKSYKEQVAKRSRGRSDFMVDSDWKSWAQDQSADALKLANTNDTLPFDDSIYGKREYVFDDSAWQLLKKNVPAYRLYDEIGLLPSTNRTGVKIRPNSESSSKPAIHSTLSF